jgi:tetratricopeptide (TPR) repeat protein
MIFISHSTTDDAAVDRIADQLEAAGLSTWVDHRKGIPLAQQWDPAIRKAIADCSVMVFVMSPRALASDICGGECLLARELGKPLYVARLEDCAAEDIWLYIKQIQYADLVTDFDGGVGLLIEALQGGSGEDLPTATQGRVTGGDTMRQHLPYLQNPLRGRDSDLQIVQSTLGPSVLQLVGPGGLGKSRLAAEVALSYTAGAVWHRCSAVTQDVDLLALLRQHTGLPDDAQQALVLDRLEQHPPLVVVDNAEDVTDAARSKYVELLMALIGRNVPILLTTRRVWPELKPRRDHAPSALSVDVGAQIALDFAESENLDLSAEDAATLAQKARLHPRLIEFAVGQLHERALARVIKQLEELKHADIKDALDEMILKTLRQMHEQAANGPEAESLIRRLTLLQGPFTVEAVQALAPESLSDEDDLEDALVTLQRWQFLRRDTTNNRYSLTSLVREALGLPEDPALFEAYARFFIDCAKAVFEDLPPEQWRAHEDDLPDIHALGDRLMALTENGTTGDATMQALALDFASNTTNYIYRRMEANKWPWLEMGLALSRSIGDQGKQSVFLNQLGLALSALGKQRKALDYYEKALRLIRVVGDQAGEAGMLNNIGAVWSVLGKKEKALGYYEEALPLMRVVGDRAGEAGTLNNIGMVWSSLREKEKALDYYEQSLLLRRVVGDRSGEARTLNNIGAVWSVLGEKEKALGYYEEALSLRYAVGDRAGEADTLHNIGVVYLGLGDLDQAIEYVAQSISLGEQIKHPSLHVFQETLTRLKQKRDSKP